MALSLVGFSRMNLKFSKLQVTGSFLEALPRTLRAMDAQEVSNTVWALGKLEVSWDSLPLSHRKSISEAITATCRKMSPQGVANALLGLKISLCLFL